MPDSPPTPPGPALPGPARAAPLAGALLAGALLIGAPAAASPERGLSPPPAAAPAAPPQHRLFYTSATFARVNPLGLISVSTLGWRGRLVDAPASSTLFGDTYAFVGASARLSPAFGRLGVHAEVSPIALLKLWTAVEAVGYFGTFNQITSFPEQSPVYDDDTLDALEDGAATGGWVATSGAVLQAKAGPVVARSTFQATRYALRLAAGDVSFYDQYWDRLAPNEQWMFLNDLDVMGMGEHLRLGARWTWTDGAGAEVDPDSLVGMGHHRVGPLFAWQFKDEGPGSRFDKPTLFALAQWWLEHPYRAGQEVSQGMPLVAFGFAFQGDLLGPRPGGG